MSDDIVGPPPPPPIEWGPALVPPEESNGTAPESESLTALQESLLSGVLLVGMDGVEALPDVRTLLQGLRPHAFTGHYRDIARVIWKLLELGQPVDMASVLDVLDGSRKPEAGRLLIELTDYTAVPLLPRHAELLREHWHRRRLQEGVRHALEDGIPVSGVLAKIEALTAELHGEAIQGSKPNVRVLSEILSTDGVADAPEPVCAPIAYRGRNTLLVSREKQGKTTMLCGMAAAVTRGFYFGGHEAQAGTVLYLRLEGHQGDWLRQLLPFQPDPEKLYVLERMRDPLGELEAAAAHLKPDLIIIDTLAALVESMGLDPGKGSDWRPVMSRLSRTAQEIDAAMTTSHHSRKEGDEYADSREIGAGVDQIMILGRVQGDPFARSVKAGRGRWTIDDFVLRYVEPDDERGPAYYQPGTSELPLETRLLQFIRMTPGCGANEIRESVGGRRQDVKIALTKLERSGYIENVGSGQSHAYKVSKKDQPFDEGELPA